MYIKKIVIENIKSIDNLTLEFDNCPGWHVLLGENGTGKSTILKGISICLFEVKEIFALRENFSSWARQKSLKNDFQVQIIHNEKYDADSDLIPTSILKRLYFTGSNFSKLNVKTNYLSQKSNSTNIKSSFIVNKNKQEFTLNKNTGWFSTAFGPFRRIGNKQLNSKTLSDDGRLTAHISLFDDSYTLVNTLGWLQELKFKTLDKKLDPKVLEYITNLFNLTGLLPDGIQIKEINSEGVYITNEAGFTIDFYDMSDGYKSLLGLTIELIRQLFLQYDFDTLFHKEVDKDFQFQVPGVVLIDEVDIHLHPTWQAKIGHWFKQYFPKIQFIVTTHSPIICQSAEGGHIWKLENANSPEKSRRIEGQEYKRLVYGNILDAYSTDAFGMNNVARSKTAEEMLDRLASLNIKSIRTGLSKEENKELKELKSILPTSDFTIDKN